MSLNTQKTRIPVKPYEDAFPQRPIRYVLGDHGSKVTVFFKDGSTETHPRLQEDT